MTERARPERSSPDNAEVLARRHGVGTGLGYSGQEYDANDFAVEKALKADDLPALQPAAGGFLPPDNGRRPSLDQKTGEIHGTGVGAGGGERGENFDNDSAAGDRVLPGGPKTA